MNKLKFVNKNLGAFYYKKHDFSGSAQDGFMSVVSASCCVWLPYPSLSGFEYSFTSRAIFEFLNDTKVHGVWNLYLHVGDSMVKCGLLWCWLKCSKGVQGV